MGWPIELEAQLQAGKTITQTSLNLIHQRWEMASPRGQFLYVANNMPIAAWDVIKYKIAVKLVTKTSFQMTFGGSSVTAGHDNFFNESYPSICERRLRPTFAALNITFHLHNIAHGNNRCRPYSFCYETMGGSSPDWIGWEQSFDCGRDQKVFETMARLAQWNKAVLYFAASGSELPKCTNASTDRIPWISEDWTPETEPLFSRTNINSGNNSQQSLLYRPYQPTLSEVLTHRQMLDAYYREGSSVSRFISHLRPYKGVAPHGYSVFSRSRELCHNDITNRTGCDAIQIMGTCQGLPHGTHWMSKEVAEYGLSSLYNSTNNNSTKRHRPAGHHPPKSIHLQRGEFIAYNFLHAMLDAIYMVEADLHNTSTTLSDAVQQYQNVLSQLQDFPLPAPSHCGLECTTRPICYTDFRPHIHPKYHLDEVLVYPYNSSNHRHTELNNQVGMNHTLSSLYEWTRTVHLPAQPVELGHQDVKVRYETKTMGASLHLRVNISPTTPPHGIANYLRICGSQSSHVHGRKDLLRHSLLFLQPNVTIIPANGTTGGGFSSVTQFLPSGKEIPWTKVAYVGDECLLMTELPYGEHVLTITSNTTSIQAFSHLILYESKEMKNIG